jgi:hypothetical protein
MFSCYKKIFEQKMRCVAGATPDANGRALISTISADANGRARTFSDAGMRRPVGDALLLRQKSMCNSVASGPRPCRDSPRLTTTHDRFSRTMLQNVVLFLKNVVYGVSLIRCTR